MRIILFALILCVSPMAHAADAAIVLSSAWLRASLGQSGVSAGYVTIENKGTADDTLVGVATSLNAMAHLHESTMKDGVMQMKPVHSLVVKGGQSLEMKPGGLHIMIMGLKTPLKAGDPVTFDLEFERAGHVKVDATVRAIERTQ